MFDPLLITESVNASEVMTVQGEYISVVDEVFRLCITKAADKMPATFSAVLTVMICPAESKE
jgi:hypothetical protein